MVESTAKLRSEILALSGVDIMENATEFKSTYKIMDELAAKWQDLSDIQQATVTELIAGKRQGNIVSSLMTNFDTARDALETSMNSAGSAMKEHEKWQESLEARINSLKASWQSLSQTFLDSDFLKVGIDAIAKFIEAIDSLIDNFGLLGTAAGGVGLYNIFKNKVNWNGVSNSFSLAQQWISNIALSTDTLSGKFRNLGRMAKTTGRDMRSAFAGVAKDIGKLLAIMGIIKALQDIASWMSKLGDESETTAEKFDRISSELSDVESELSGLESELSSVESQIDALLEKDELTFADEEELARLREVSSELERQIQLAETLQESLNKSLSATAIDAYGDYVRDTSFYSTESKQDRKEEGKSLGSAIGNIVGLIVGGALAAYTGGSSLILTGAGIGSVLGSAGGNLAGGAISGASYDGETTVLEMLDRMHIERTKLEKAKDEAYKAYTDNPTDKNIEAWENAETALSDYDASLAKHIQQLSEYRNSIDYKTLDEADKDAYREIDDYINKYNIEMGVKGAKSAALDSIFDDELATEKAKELKTAIQIALDSGEEISFENFNSDNFVEMKERLADMGITLTEVISYFKELEEVQAEASNYETYDMVSNIAALSDGVTALTDAFAEFNEQGIVSAKTLVELHEVFGDLGEDWASYVDIMTNGVSSIEDAREATEQLAESHLNNLLSNGGIKFSKFNKEANRYEFDKDGYKTYLSTINELEYLGVENAKEYIDASQQRSMFQDAVRQMESDNTKKQALIAKQAEETLSEEEKTLLAKLESKDVNDYILDVESSYGIRLQNLPMQVDGEDSTLLGAQYKLNEYNSIIKDREDALDQIKGFTFKEEEIGNKYKEYLEASEKAKELENQIVQESKDRSKYETNISDTGLYIPTWNDLEGIDDLFGTEWFDTDWDAIDEASEDAKLYKEEYDKFIEEQEKLFNDMVDTAKEMDIDLSDIIDVDNFNFDAEADNAKEVFDKVYDRVKSELELSVEEYKNLADDLSAEIESSLENLGLDIDFGRYFDKIIMDGFKTKIDQIGTARTEMLSTGGLSTDSIMAVDKIFGDLNSYDSSKLFENTVNGVRLNTEEFRRLNDEFKRTNIDGLENKISDLGDQYVQTREDLYKLTYGTEEYNAKARELADIEEQIAANEELMSSYQGLFSAFQDWQRAESSGSERGMYETILGGFEGIGDEISRGWIDDGTREFLELLKGDTATIVDGNGVKKEIDLATASAKDLKQVWKDLDKTIEHTSYSVRDFFTVDEDGNSTSKGVYNFLDAIGQMEEEKFDHKDVVKRDDSGNIIGFDFQIVGGDEAIAEALGISEELVQIMTRAAIDAGFVVTFDGSYEQLDVLREKAEAAAKKMNEILKADGKATIDIDMNVDSVEDIQSQLDKIMETFGEKDGSGKLTGAINMDIEGADEAIQVASTLQSMKDKLTRPAYMDIQVSQVEEELREPLQSLQDYRTNIERLNQAKLRGADTTELEASIEESKEKVVEDLLEIQESNPKLAAELDIDGLTKEEIEKKIEAGEITIPATVDIQLDMDEKLGVLADKALYDAGLISEEEFTKRVEVYLDAEVDNSDAKDKAENAVDDVVGDETREKNIKIIAETFGVEDVEGLKSAMSGLTDEQVKAIAEAIGKGDVDALDSAVAGMDGNTVQAIANALGYSDVETLKSAINNMKGNKVDAEVNTDGQQEKVNTFQSWIDGLKGTTVDVAVNFIKKGFEAVSNWITGGGSSGDGGVNGTANVNGTTGRAFARGNWRTKKSERVLVGELGKEIIVTPNNQWYTVGDSGAEFTNIPRGSIVFNHRQTEELLKNGKVTSGGGRAKALSNGTAFVGGTAFSRGYGGGLWTNSSTGKTYGSSSSSSSSKSSSDSAKDDFEETFDWIEIAIDRVERAIDQLDTKANSIYRSWSERNSNLTSEISKVNSEINLQQRAYQEYMNAAAGVGLSSSWAAKVRNGTIDISTVKDEVLAEKIKDYQNWYEKALDCKDAILKLKETESELYAQRFQNLQTQYDGILQGYEHTETMLNEYISQAEEQGFIVSKKYYEALVTNEKQNINALKQEQAELIKARDEAVASGKITKNSEAWLEQCAAIDEITQAIEESTTALLEFDNAMREIDWSVFDLIQERISGITEESDFLIELMSNKDLFDDSGKFTSQGLATLGLHAQNVNTHMYAADTYGEEVAKLDAQIAKDPYDQELINRRNELLELQRESILAAEQEKDAIKDLVENGIEEQLNSLQELIDKKNEALESERDLYEYQKKVAEQSKEVASLEKQLAAYSGDDSEEAKQKIQQIKVDLESARQDLQETEMDKILDDTSALLDNLFLEAETLLNERIDNIDYLLEQVIETINIASSAEGNIVTALGSEGAIAIAVSNNATSIKDTLASETNKVGTTLSNAMNSIWNSGDGNAKSVLTMYGEDFKSKSATIITTLNGIKSSVNSMVSSLNKEATTKTTANKTTTSAKKNPTTPSSTTKTTTTTTKKASSGDGKPKIGDRVKYVSGQYYYDSQGKKPLGSHNKGEYVYITNINTRDWATHGYHISTGNKLGKGDLGWLKLNQLSGYASGKKNFLNDEVAWTQENGLEEYIVRPSDGAILTPIAKKGSVLNAQASDNLWNMTNSPAEFIKENLKLDASSVPSASNVNNSIVQNFENVVFSMPNVHGYNELLREMQSDPKFEKLVLSMTVDRIAGRSKLAKGKSIR